LNLSNKIGFARAYFLSKRGPVLRGAAFDGVGDVGLGVSLDTSRFKDFGEQLARFTNKRQSVEVFLFSWALANDHEVARNRPRANDDLGTGFG
jgi:hypothetical protein